MIEAMRQSNRRPLEFFRDDDGSLPVVQWLDSLPLDVRAKFAGHIELLAEYGPTLDFPFTSQIDGKLRELRMRVGKTRYRILYFFDSRQVGMLLHGFTKDTAAVSASDGDIGRQRMRIHANRLLKRGGK